MRQSYYLFSNGKLQRKDNSLSLIKEDGTKADIPVERVYDIYSFGVFPIIFEFNVSE